MNTQTFIDFCTSHHSKRMRIMEKPVKKRMGGTDDRFRQFRRMAEAEQNPAAYTALSKCDKQFFDIMDMLHYTPSDEIDIRYLEELVSDVQNYLDIALGIVHEDVGKFD